jgi:mutator protein MutT
MRQDVTLIAVAVVEHRDRFLVGRRPEGAPLGGYAEFPGGKVLPGETPEAAAARECLEETGLPCTVGEPYPEVVHHYAHDRLRLCFFACAPVDPSAEPKPPFRWVERAELASLKFPEANGALIELLTRAGA